MGWIERERGCCRSACRCAHATSDTHTHACTHGGTRNPFWKQEQEPPPEAEATTGITGGCSSSSSSRLYLFASLRFHTNTDAGRRSCAPLALLLLSLSLSLSHTDSSQRSLSRLSMAWQAMHDRETREEGGILSPSLSLRLSRCHVPHFLLLCLSPTDSRLLPRFSQSCGITPCCMSSSGKGTVMQEKEAAGTSLASHEGSLPVSLDLRLARTSAT